MIPLVLFVQLEVTLTAIAIGVSFRARHRAATFGATAASAAATGLALVFVWIVWFVAPWCLADPNLIACTAGQAGTNSLLLVLEIALLEWAWMLCLALGARFVAGRHVAHLSG